MTSKLAVRFFATSLTVASLAGRGAAAQSRTVYVPVVSVTRSASDPASPQLESRSLLSRLDIYNGGTIPGSVYFAGVFGPCGPNTVVYDPLGIGPNDVLSLGRPMTFGCAGDYVGFAEVSLPDAAQVSATLQRSHSYRCEAGCNGANPGHVDVSLGEIPLPVFADLTPAGSTAASGRVPLFNESAFDACGLAERRYPRRVNLTVFNAGAQAANVHVKATPGSAPFVFDHTYQVPARTVLQFNSLPVVEPETCPAAGQTPVSSLWFLVTADQPSLSYVSTTFDADEPDSIRYDIFPSRPIPTDAPACANVGGTYQVSWSDRCGNTGSSQWTLIQDGCSVHTPLVPDAGSVAGTVSGDVFSLTLTSGFIACSYSLPGTARLVGNVLQGQVSGDVSGGGCCSPQLISFTAVRQ